MASPLSSSPSGSAPSCARLLSSFSPRRREELLFPPRQKVQNIQREAGAHHRDLPPLPPLPIKGAVLWHCEHFGAGKD